MIDFVLEFLIQNTIWSVLTCCLVVCVALILKRRPAVIHLVCVLSLIAMLTPPLFSVAVSNSGWIGNFRSAEKADASSQTKVKKTEAVPLSARQTPHFVTDTVEAASDLNAKGADSKASIAEPADSDSDASVGVVESRPSGLQEPTSVWPSFVSAWPSMIAIWMIGSLVFFIVTLRQVLRFRNLIFKAKPARKQLVAIVENESKRIRLKRPPTVLELNASISPFVFLSSKGPKLVMPSALSDQLSDTELRSLVVHELAHIKRRDPVVRFVELIVAIVFWCNPALWVIRYHLRRSEELACDAVVAKSIGGNPEAYAGAFLKTIDFLSVDCPKRPPSLICTVGGYRFCRQRVKAMVSASNQVGVTRKQGIVIATIALPLLVASCFSATDGPEKPVILINEQPVANNLESRGIPKVGSALAGLNEDELTTLDLEVMKELSAIKETPKIIFHYRSEDLDEETLAQVVKNNLDKFEQCEKLLKMKYEGRVHIFLYRDVPDLQKTTGTEATAFATGKVSIHQASNFNSVHELVHIFALQFQRDEDAVTDDFAVEGLATILAEHDENIPIHSWAAVYQSRSRLPSLVDLRRTWPDGVSPGVHPYHVAGSFVGYLIEKFGIEKVKRWYVHSTEAHMEFGKTFRRIERDWQEWLEQKQVQPKHRNHILAKIGLIPDKYQSATKMKLFNGKSLDGLAPDNDSDWKVENGVLVGSNKNTWSFIATERKFPVNVGVKLRFRLVEGKAISVLLNRTKDSKSHVNLATWASYMSLTNGAYVVLEHLKLEPGKWNEVVVVNENGLARFYLNGLVIHEHDGAFYLNEGELGIGIESGTIEVEEFESFEVPPTKLP